MIFPFDDLDFTIFHRTLHPPHARYPDTLVAIAIPHFNVLFHVRVRESPWPRIWALQDG